MGPTADDITREAVAALFDRELRRDDGLLESLRERFRRRGYGELPATNISQTEVPQGALVLDNPLGTAPGLAIENDSVWVVMLPGVPRELRGIFDGDLSALLDTRFGDRMVPVHHRMIHTTGISESRLAELLDEALRTDPSFASASAAVSIAYLPDLRGVDLRLTAAARSSSEAAAALDALEEGIDTIVGRWRYRAESGDIVEAVSEALHVAGMTLAIAESCTAGLIGKRITDRAGASRVFLGGVVAYHDSAKTAALGVSEEDLERFGAVSEEVARQMALGVAERWGADAGLAVTGIAGPDGGTEDKPVGMVWFGVAIDGEARTTRVDFVGDRSAVRERAAQCALALLLRAIERHRR